MGRVMQKRLVRKLDLEIALAKIEPHPHPKAHLEQYTITPEVAAEILYIAAYTNNDVTDKTILDMGCGTGRLAIGGILLGAKEAVGIDIDKSAVKAARKCAEKLGAKEKTHWVAADIAALRGTFDTVLQNPPFGVQKRKADRRFLEKALEVGKHIYSLHKSSGEKLELVTNSSKRKSYLASATPSPFLERFTAEHGGKVTAVYRMLMVIPRIFEFHTKRKHKFFVDLYIIEARKAGGCRS
jgi:putative methylase